MNLILNVRKAVFCLPLLAVSMEIECLIVQKRMDDITLICSDNTVLSPAFCTEDSCLGYELISLLGFI